MFRSFIYLDESKMNSYKSILEQSTTYTKTVSRTKKKIIGLNTKSPLNAEYSDEKTFTEEINSDPAFVYDEFEKMLSSCQEDEYFDFIVYGDSYDLSTLPQMSIIRIKGYLEIPESFDLLNLIEQYKPFLLSSIGTDENADIIKSVFSNTNADVPVIIDTGDVLISGKLNTDNLYEDYAALEDYAEQEINFLCKVEGFVKRDRVTIYNPAKDFIKLNRAMRRASNLEENQTLSPITVDGPVLKAEIIAIYK